MFADTNGNGLDDGQEVQDNMYRALFETMEAYPGLVHGAFFWDTWIAVNEGHWESPGHEAVEGGAGDAGDLGDGGLGHAQLEEVTDFILLAVES